MATHEGLVHAVVRKQVLGDLPFADALQAGRIGLWHAILGFDPQRGMAFSTYAWTCIMHRVWREVKLAERAQGQAAKCLPLTGVASWAGEDGNPARVCASAATLGSPSLITSPGPLAELNAVRVSLSPSSHISYWAMVQGNEGDKKLQGVLHQQPDSFGGCHGEV
jgi:hypothetical protein